jgi:predicted PurR-regulated permease PerM
MIGSGVSTEPGVSSLIQGCLKLAARQKYREFSSNPCGGTTFCVQLGLRHGGKTVNQNWLVTAFFFALLLLILYGAFLILSPFLTAITWAMILAILFYPFYAWLLRLVRGRATLAALLVIVIITTLVIVPGIQLAWFLSDETISLVQTIRALLDEEGKQQWLAKPWVQHVMGWWNMVTFRLVDFKINWKDLLIQGAQSSSTFIVAQVKGIAQNVLVFTANFFLALFTLFFFLRDGAAFVSWAQRLLPMDREHQERLFRNIVDAVTAVVHGSLVVAMVQGLLAGLGYWVLGVPFAVLWGVITAFAALLPFGGTTLITIPVSLYLFLQGDNVKGIFMLIWGLGVVVTIDNVLKPLFIGTRIKLPMLILFFGILGGLAVFGALGLILGPVVFVLLAVLLDLYTEEYGVNE